MKFKTLVLLSLIASNALAEDVNFRWDANTEPDLVGYNIYRATTSMGYTKGVIHDTILCPPNDLTCCRYTDVDVPDGTFFWVVTAEDSEGFESDYSNEQTKTVTNTTDPSAPSNLQIDEVTP